MSASSFNKEKEAITDFLDSLFIVAIIRSIFPEDPSEPCRV